MPGLRARSQETETRKCMLIHLFICVYESGALLTPGEAGSGKGSSFQLMVDRTGLV